MARPVLCTFFLCWLTCSAFSQNVQLLKLDQLQNRISAGKDTTYIINFWATWCAPCIKEIPNFEKLNAAHTAEKLKILLISVDFRSQLNSSVIPFVKKKKLKNETYLLDEADQQEYINRIDPGWSGAIPATLFIKNNNRKFIEQEFSYSALLNEYQTINKL